jgi:hypothetical protein
MVGMIRFGLEGHRPIIDWIAGAAIGAAAGWSSGYRTWVHNEREFLNWPTSDLNLNGGKRPGHSDRA